MISLIEDIDENETNKSLIDIIKELFKVIIIIILPILILCPIFILGNIFSKLFKEDNKLLLNNIILKMNELDEIKNNITSAEYLYECNRLKSIYDRLKNA
jgi:hypothetical protein